MIVDNGRRRQVIPDEWRSTIKAGLDSTRLQHPAKPLSGSSRRERPKRLAEPFVGQADRKVASSPVISQSFRSLSFLTILPLVVLSRNYALASTNFKNFFFFLATSRVQFVGLPSKGSKELNMAARSLKMTMLLSLVSAATAFTIPAAGVGGMRRAAPAMRRCERVQRTKTPYMGVGAPGGETAVRQCLSPCMTLAIKTQTDPEFRAYMYVIYLYTWDLVMQNLPSGF